MSTDTGTKYRDALVALMAPDMNATATALIDNYTQIKYNCNRGTTPSANLDAALAGVYTVALDHSTTVQMKFSSATVTFDNAITAANTDVAIFSLVYNNANGGSDTTVATINTAVSSIGGSGNVTAQVPVTLTINTSNATVPAGSQIAFKITKGGNGLASGSCHFVAKAKPV